MLLLRQQGDRVTVPPSGVALPSKVKVLVLHLWILGRKPLCFCLHRKTPSEWYSCLHSASDTTTTVCFLHIFVDYSQTLLPQQLCEEKTIKHGQGVYSQIHQFDRQTVVLQQLRAAGWKKGHAVVIINKRCSLIWTSQPGLTWFCLDRLMFNKVTEAGLSHSPWTTGPTRRWHVSKSSSIFES